MVTKEEQKLIDGCIAGKTDCQKQLYLEYGPIIKGICMRYAANPDEAEDLFQEIFVFIFTRIKDHANITSLRGWLYRIAVNKAVDYYRSRKRVKTVPIEDEGMIAGISAPPIPEVLTMDKLLAFINELPEKRRIAFNLYVIDDVGQEEISEIMGESHTNVRTLILRAKESLRKKITQYLNHEEFEL